MSNNGAGMKMFDRTTSCVMGRGFKQAVRQLFGRFIVPLPCTDHGGGTLHTGIGPLHTAGRLHRLLGYVPRLSGWTAALGLYYLIPFIPYRTMRNHFGTYPLGGSMLTVLVVAVILGALLHGKRLPRTKLYLIGWCLVVTSMFRCGWRGPWQCSLPALVPGTQFCRLESLHAHSAYLPRDLLSRRRQEGGQDSHPDHCDFRIIYRSERHSREFDEELGQVSTKRSEPLVP